MDSLYYRLISSAIDVNKIIDLAMIPTEKPEDEEMLNADHLTNAKTDTKEDGGDQANLRGGDSTIGGSDISLEGFSQEEE